MQISCHVPPIVYIFILLNYDKFPGTTSFLCVQNFTQMWSPTIGPNANCIKEKRKDI
jgi:hypothetical protein